MPNSDPITVDDSITVDWADVQGDIFQPYGHDWSAHLLVNFPVRAAGAAFLTRLRSKLTTAERWATPGPSCYNMGLTYSAMAALGLPDAELLSFPYPFRMAMAGRAGVLGDTGASAPGGWEAPYGNRDLHAWVMVTGATAAIRDAALADLMALAAVTGVTVLRAELADDLSGPGNRTKDHFGFDDGIGQPAVAGAPGPAFPGQGSPGSDGALQPLALGAFLCGYANELGYDPPFPASAQLRRNGTFMAYRKLEEHVALFRDYIAANKALIGGDGELLAAKMVGRWRSGAPLALAPDRDDPALGADDQRNDDFGFADDPDGLRVPHCAHIRRTNPRQGLPKDDVLQPRLHRIIRRKMPYGAWLPEGSPDDGQPRGIIFRAYNADLVAQFEMVQSQWIASANGAGGLSTDQDPIAGLTDSTDSGPNRLATFAIPCADGDVRTLYELPRFVTLKGGEYFFVPGLAAIDWIVAQGSDADSGAGSGTTGDSA